MTGRHTLEERKRVEKAYYDRQAAGAAARGEADLRVHGPDGLEPHLRAPYVAYRHAIEHLSTSDSVVVDLGAGTGLHSFLAPHESATVVATDISSASLQVARARAAALRRRVIAIASDGECLPLRDATVDLVTSAGVLYCMDAGRVVAEIARVLHPGGAWVLVDSYNHSPIYRLNRLLGYLRGTRTRRAYTHIPDANTIRLIRSRFDDVSVRYFGTWTFLWPLLRRLLGAARATAALARLEPPRMLRAHAFKILVIARSPRAARNGR